MKFWKIGTFVALVMFLPSSLQAVTDSPDRQAEQLFEEVFEQWVALSPMWQTQLGRSTHKGLWDDISPAASDRAHSLYQQQLQKVQALDARQLTPANQLNRRLLIDQLTENIRFYRWRDHSYPVNQMFGWHSRIPAFLINSHTIRSEEDVVAFIARLQGIAPLMEQLIDNLKRRAEKGILPPDFVYPLVIDDCRNIIRGAPFSSSVKEESPLWRHFQQRLKALSLAADKEQRYLAQAKQILQTSVRSAYQDLMDYLSLQARQADSRAGVWKLPQGQAYYQAQLQAMTTTDLTAEQIHQIGLDAVARIHKEMRSLKNTIGFTGSLQAFFRHLQQDPQFYYPNTEQGRAEYLADTRRIIDDVRQVLPEIFGRMPKASLQVKAVEAFREKSAGKAFYQAPAEDGSRPGIYYVNLHDLSAMPKYQMQALAYHEALPGHHMQIAIAQELPNTPSFRRYGHYTAYIEGWGLYAEQITKTLGLYRDPYADFGRLSFELWRAIRLVVDTGLHHYRWSREQAIDYFVRNSPMTRADARREVERYIVLPGQATSYMIGMLEIERLQEQSRQKLGDSFSLAEFHDLILGFGALPLTVLDEQVSAWIDSKIRP